MTLPNEVIAWAEVQCGGKVVDIAEQIRWRPHHFLTIERPADTIHVVARSQRTEMADTGFARRFDIAHEARVLEALQDRGLKVPQFLGFNEDFGVILMEKVAGTNEFGDAPDDDTRKKVMAEYIEQLAKLHQLDVETMHLSGLSIPTTPEQAAFGGKFKYIEEDFTNWRPHLRAEPFLELGIWWLHTNIPGGERRVSFVQADTGPGQFMFADGCLTALIDWEVSHIGDPMLDLGVMRMRNLLYPTGSLAEPLAYYEQVSGHSIDWQALRFYTVMSMLLTPMGVSPLMQHPTAHSDHTLPAFGWDATLRRGLGEALAEAIGMEIEPPELPEPAAAQYPSLGDYLVEYLDLKCETVAADDAGRFRISSAAAIARSVLLESKVGGELLDADLDDMGDVLGRRPGSRNEGLAQLSEMVADDPSHYLERLVWLFARIERRREFLLEPLMVSQSSGAYERLTPHAVA